MLETTDITQELDGVRTVDGLDVRIDSGEVHGLLGPNGAGKTTTINLFLGFLRPTGGTVRIANWCRRWESNPHSLSARGF